MLWWTIRQLKSKNYKVQELAIEKLGKKKNSKAVKRLIEVLKDKNSDDLLRLRVGKALFRIGEKAVEPLIIALKDSNSLIRKIAAETLGKIRDERAIEPLTALLKDRNKEVREKTALALNNLGYKPIDDEQKALMILAHKDIPSKEYEKVIALGVAAVEPWFLRAETLSWQHEDALFTALARIGESAIEPIINIFKHSDDHKKRHAFLGLLAI